MYRVNSEFYDRVPTYFVEDQDGNRKPGHFDCERSAQAFADYLNDKEREKESWNRKGANIQRKT